MRVPKTVCPECNAGLTSKAGFEVGDAIECPKCETYFEVTAPKAIAKPAAKPRVVDDDDEPAPPKKAAKAQAVDDDDDDEPPVKKKLKKKKKKKSRVPAYDDEDDAGGSYKTSPVRFIILGVLVIVMGVLAYMLWQKRKKDKEAAVLPSPSVLAEKGGANGFPPAC